MIAPTDRDAFVAEQAARALAECQQEVDPGGAARIAEYVAEGLADLPGEGDPDPLVRGRGLAAEYSRCYARWKIGDLATRTRAEVARGRWRRVIA